MSYRDLPEFGIHFVTREDARFGELTSSISTDPFGPQSGELPQEAAVVLNESGKAILAMSFLWRWADGNGRVADQRAPGLSSLSQLQVDPTDIRSTWFHPFLAGSKRLITPAGAFGDNSDVLPAEYRPSGFIGPGRAMHPDPEQHRRQMRTADHHLLGMQLDSVIFEDGECVGADDMAILAAIGFAAGEQHRITSEAAALLRSGARLGDVFELLRNTARIPGPSPNWSPADHAHLLFSFGRQAISRLVNTPDEHRDQLIRWFEQQAVLPLLRQKPQ